MCSCSACACERDEQELLIAEVIAAKNAARKLSLRVEQRRKARDALAAGKLAGLTDPLGDRGAGVCACPAFIRAGARVGVCVYPSSMLPGPKALLDVEDGSATESMSKEQADMPTDGERDQDASLLCSVECWEPRVETEPRVFVQIDK